MKTQTVISSLEVAVLVDPLSLLLYPIVDAKPMGQTISEQLKTESAILDYPFGLEVSEVKMRMRREKEVEEEEEDEKEEEEEEEEEMVLVVLVVMKSYTCRRRNNGGSVKSSSCRTRHCLETTQGSRSFRFVLYLPSLMFYPAGCGVIQQNPNRRIRGGRAQDTSCEEVREAFQRSFQSVRRQAAVELVKL